MVLALLATARPASSAAICASTAGNFTKTFVLDDPDSNGLDAGDTFHYTVRFCHGNDDQICQFQDTLPAGLTLVPGTVKCVAAPTPNPPICAEQPPGSGIIVVQYNSGTKMAQNGCVTLTFDATVNVDPTTTVCNQAKNTRVPADLSTNACKDPPLKPRLTLVKDAVDVNGGNLEPGDAIQYTLTVANVSTGVPPPTLTQVTLQDLLPPDALGKPLLDPAACPLAVTSPDLTPAQYTVNGTSCAATPPSLGIFGFDLTPGKSVRFVFTAPLRCDLTNGTNVLNSATANATAAPTNPPPATASKALTVKTGSLAITKTASANPAKIGDVVTYTYTVAAIDNPVDGVVLTDDLSQIDPCFNLSLGTSTCSPAGCYDIAVRRVTQNFGTVNPGTPVSFTVSVPADAIGTCVNTASVTRTEVAGCKKTYPSNPATVRVYDPSVLWDGSTKDDAIPALSSVKPGTKVRYTIVVHNAGTAPAQQVILTDVFDPCLDLSGFNPTASPSQVSVAPGPASTTWSPATRTLVVTFRNPVAAGADQIVTLTGIMAGPDNPRCCNRATIRDTVNPGGFLTEDKELGTGPTCMLIESPASFLTSTKDDAVPVTSVLLPGDPIVYTLQIKNSAGLGHNVRLADTLSSCLDLSTFNPASFPAQVRVTPGPGTVTWTAATRLLVVDFPNDFGPSPSGDQTVVLSGIKAGVPNPSCCNQALITSRSDAIGVATKDLETGGPETCVHIAAPASFVTSTKDSGVPPGSCIQPGLPVTYTVKVKNSGELPANNVTVTDVLQACLDLSAFDPVANPTQVTVTPGPATAMWTAATRTLIVTMTAPVAPAPAGEQTIKLTGILGGPVTPSCCNQATVLNDGLTTPTPTIDKNTGAGPSCVEIKATLCTPVCATSPPTLPISGLMATKAGLTRTDIAFQWGATSDPLATAYNLWKVVTPTSAAAKTKIPSASKAFAIANPGDVVNACLEVALGSPACVELAAVTSAPAAVFYEGRNLCADKVTEGPH